MHPTIQRCQSGSLVYYTCQALPVRHAFTSKAGGVSTGHCASLNLGFHRGDREENVRENYALLAQALQVPAARLTLTHQVHGTAVQVAAEDTVGMGLARPMEWDCDALITALPDTPIVGFYADCIVTLLYDPVSHAAGVCHSGWRGVAQDIPGRTVDAMAERFGADRSRMLAVMGPSIRACCFETDGDVPEQMCATMGDACLPYITKTETKYHVDLQGLCAMQWQRAGLQPEHVIDSGICTKCESETFWSHRATNGVRGVQGAVICL